MQTTLNRPGRHMNTATANRLPLTFQVSRFTPPIHQAVLHPQGDRTPPHNHLSLSNTDGFWELAFDNHHAVLVQDQALFYVAFLLAHPGESFLPLDLAEKVYELYGAHPDFRQNLPGLDARLLHAREAVVLQKKVQD